MRRSGYLLVLMALVALALPVRAGIFGKKEKKPNPADRVAELIVTVKTSQEEQKRSAAAEELREFDPATYPDIVPILIDVLRNDPKPSVRAEAAQSLGKLRPVIKEAGWALEQAVANDSSMKVRLQARSSLLMYHWAGYQSPKTNEPPLLQTKEPPLAPPDKGPPLVPPGMPPMPKPSPMPPKPTGPTAHPLPVGPSLAPADPPRLQPPPPSPPGPDLTPPW